MTKQVRFTGKKENLELFNFSGIKYASIVKIKNDEMVVTWLFENKNQDVRDYIDADQMNLWNVKVA